MKKQYWILGIILWVLLLYSGLDLAQRRSDRYSRERRGGDSGFMNQYGLILERNIFTRDRGRREPEPSRVERNVAPPPPPQKSYVLIGISRWGDEYIAFVENTRYGDTQMYRIGNTVAEMKIKHITLDNIELEKDAKTITIQVGSDLTGGAQTSSLTMQDLLNPVGESAPSSPASGIAGATKTEPAPTDSTDTDDILKKLMERRKKELEQK